MSEASSDDLPPLPPPDMPDDDDDDDNDDNEDLQAEADLRATEIISTNNDSNNSNIDTKFSDDARLRADTGPPLPPPGSAFFFDFYF